MADHGEWKLVSRRRRCLDNGSEKTVEPQKLVTRPFVPYTQSYAQAVAMPVSNQPARNTRPIPSSSIPLTVSPTTSPPSPSTHRSPSQTYISPHSPTALRFPPSPFFVEWRGRCFRCCRTGHAAASCQFPVKCGKCWANGHVGSRCKKVNTKQMLNPAAKPFSPATCQKMGNVEPSFDSMLTGTDLHVPPVMPVARSLMHTCFVERDAEYYTELERLSSAIVVNTPDGVEVEKIAEFIASSGMVKVEDMSFASLTHGRYLVHLPNGLSTAPVIRAIPAMAWEIGLDFQEWSPLDIRELQ